jgi:hypothetical protein
MGDLMEVLKNPSKIKIFAWKALGMLSLKKKELGIQKKGVASSHSDGVIKSQLASINHEANLTIRTIFLRCISTCQVEKKSQLQERIPYLALPKVCLPFLALVKFVFLF